MIDSHAHIYLPEFDEDRNEVIKRAKQAGITRVMMPDIDSTTTEAMLKVHQLHPAFCFPMTGLHPGSVKENFEDELALIEKNLHQADIKYYGIGECGLDYFWDKTFLSQQKTAFEFQIQLAKQYRLPIIIHSREAIDDCIEMIEKHKDDNLQGVFHCFTGNPEQLERIIQQDFMIGIGGVATFKNGGLDKILEPQHVRSIILETDAPYLAPVPFRGKRNEPFYLTHIISRLSEITKSAMEDIKKITDENCIKLFNLKT